MEISNSPPFALTDAARAFAALGSEPRLQVLTTLVRAGDPGLAVGELATRCGISGSTLTHHLRALALAGLVAQEKRGRSIVCSANFDQVQALSDYLINECCQDCQSHPRAAHHRAHAPGH
ncbi:MAG: metalloregulator ArsR/SmtB family transcription factor [Pseudomonadota bacterium]